MNNPEYHKRTKHIDLQYHFVGEKYEQKEIDVVCISTEQHVTNIMAKALARAEFEHFRGLMSVVSLQDVRH